MRVNIFVYTTVALFGLFDYLNAVKVTAQVNPRALDVPEQLIQVAALSNAIPVNCNGGPSNKTNEDKFMCYLRGCESRKGAEKTDCIDALQADLVSNPDCTGNTKELWCQRVYKASLNW